MEIHHHSDVHHKKKRFKESFLEFLMIFLAVSMGFLAEKIREGLADKNKELHYMQNLVADLGKELLSLQLYKSSRSSCIIWIPFL
jgi:hypothetical protein